MRRLFIVAALFACTVASKGQDTQDTFKGYFYNDEYEVYLRLDLHGDGISVPSHEIFGPLPGYLARQRNNFYWLVTAANVKGGSTATLSLINDYGSEDLEASLSLQDDSTFVFRQEDGSALKVPNKGKWQKLPKEFVMKKRK